MTKRTDEKRAICRTCERDIIRVPIWSLEDLILAKSDDLSKPKRYEWMHDREHVKDMNPEELRHQVLPQRIER